MSDCFKLKYKEELLKTQQSSNPQTGLIGHISSCGSVQVDVCSVPDGTVSAVQVEKPMPGSGSVMESFQPFMHDGFVSLSGDFVKSTPIKVLRDTGSSQSLMLSDTLPFSDSSFSGNHVLIKGVDSDDFVSVPLHDVHLKSRLVSGPVTVGVRASLPFGGIQLLLGNDLAGDKVVVDPIVSDKPCVDQSVDPVEQENPDLDPACAVTRSMSKKVLDIPPSDDDLSATLEEPVIRYNGLCKTVLDVSNLIKSQRAVDSDTALLFQKAVTPEEAILEPVCFYVKNGVLMRKWRPPDVSADDDWAVQHQVVVPKSYRPKVLSIAHETPLSGHLGVNKTYLKILKHFYWPNMKSDVAQFCRSCHTCQMVGKPNQTIPKAHLLPIPAFDEPFSRILVDCVGPLPETRSGNECLLTVMCTSTRIPEAIPLRSIGAETVVKAVMEFFTMIGLPKSDQFQQVMCELGLNQCKTYACHPESQGALERFHKTVKKIQSYCFDTD